MKTTLTILTLFLVLQTFAASTGYYVSPTGNDANNGTSPATAWKTINKVNASISSFNAGDNIFFERNGTYFGTLNFTRSGTSSNPINIGAYGTGANPVITTLQNVVVWTSVGGNKYKSSVSSPTMLKMVVIDNEPREMGRWPNIDQPNAGYRSVFSRNTTTRVLTDQGLSTAPGKPSDLGGALLCVRGWKTHIDNSSVTSISGDNVGYSPLEKGNPEVGYGYFFKNTLGCLDKNYEWYFDKNNSLLYVYSSTGPPTNVKISNSDKCLNVSGSYVNITGITFSGSNGENLANFSGNFITTDGCDFLCAGVNNVNISGQNVSILNGNIKYSLNTGVQMGVRSLVKGNNIIKSGWLVGMGKGGDGQYCGVINRNDYGVLEANFIDSVGQHGVSTNHAGASTINNEIAHTLMWFSDAGAIYAQVGADKKHYWGAPIYILGNYIHDVIVQKYGLPEWNNPKANINAFGFYADGSTNNVKFRRNVVTGVPFACVFINQSWNMDIDSNLVITNGITPIKVQDQYSLFQVDSLRFKNNLWAVYDNANSEVFQWKNYRNKLSEVKFAAKASDVNNNKFHNIFTTSTAKVVNVTNKSETGTGYVDATWSLDQWRTLMHPVGVDKNSFGPTTLAVLKANTTAPGNFKTLYNFSNAPKTYTLENRTWISTSGVPTEDGIQYKQNTITLQPYKGVILINTPDVPLETGGNTAPSVAITSPSNNQSFPYPSSIDITATASDADGTVSKVEFYANNVFIGTKTAAPYVQNWTPSPGTYQLTARATDNGGLITVSNAVTVVIASNNNIPPNVILNAPLPGVNYQPGDKIYMNASASDPDGTIAKVEFYANGDLLAIVETGTYEFTWTAPDLEGLYTITAVAYDNNGTATTSNASTIYVTGAVKVPTKYKIINPLP